MSRGCQLRPLHEPASGNTNHIRRKHLWICPQRLFHHPAQTASCCLLNVFVPAPDIRKSRSHPLLAARPNFAKLYSQWITHLLAQQVMVWAEMLYPAAVEMSALHTIHLQRSPHCASLQNRPSASQSTCISGLRTGNLCMNHRRFDQCRQRQRAERSLHASG